jgi:hypothetical protein
MMKAADLRDRHDGASAGRRDRPRDRRVFVQRQVRAGPFVVRAIEGHQTLQPRFVEHNHVINTLATSGSNESFDEGILPRRARCREHVLNPERLRGEPQAIECVIAIVEQVSRRVVPRKGLAQLLGRPRRCWMRRHGDVPDASPIVGEEHQDEQEAVGRSRDLEEIRRHDLADVVPQECAPGLRRRLASEPNVFRNGRLTDVDPQFSSSP